MSEIIFISSSGESLPIAWRMKSQGRDVSVYVHNPLYRKNYEGIFDNRIKINELRKKAKDADCVIFDIVRPNEGTPDDKAMLKSFGISAKSPSVFGPVADKLSSYTKVIGASEYTESLELDRDKGVEFARRAGIAVPYSEKFTDIQKAVDFLAKNLDKLWVIKPLNNDDLDMTYVEKFKGELITKLQNEYKDRLSDSPEFMLQEKINGTEISTEVWVYKGNITVMNHTFESKRLMNSNLGPSIGSQSNTVWVRKNQGLLTEQLNRAVKNLKDYTGPVDVNCIVPEDGIPYFLEWTMRMGWDALYCLLSLYKGSVTDFFMNNQKSGFNDGFASSERLSIPPYPYYTPKLLKKYAKDISITEDIELKNFWFQDVYYKNGLKCAGADGILGVAADKGNSIGSSYGRVYRLLDKMRVCSYKQYRTDGASQNEKRFNKLVNTGVKIK